MSLKFEVTSDKKEKYCSTRQMSFVFPRIWEQIGIKENGGTVGKQ